MNLIDTPLPENLTPLESPTESLTESFEPSTSKPLTVYPDDIPVGTPTSADSCRDISNALYKYRLIFQNDADNAYCKKAIQNLVKKLKQSNRNELDNLIIAVSTYGKYRCKCVTIPKTLDGRMQIAGRKGTPHVIFGQIWRWTNVLKTELAPLVICRFPYDYERNITCVNPYHYERIVNLTDNNDISRRLISEAYYFTSVPVGDNAKSGQLNDNNNDTHEGAQTKETPVQSYQGQPVLINLPKSPLPQLDDNRKGSADEILTATEQSNQGQSFLTGFPQSPTSQITDSSNEFAAAQVTIQSNQKELYELMSPILPLSQPQCLNNGLPIVQSNQGQSFLPNIPSQPNGQQYLSNNGQSNVQSNIDKSSLLAGLSQTSSFEARGCNNGQYTIESNQGQSPLSDFSSLSSSLPNSPRNDTSTVQNKQRQLSFKSGFTQSPSPEASGSSIGSPTGHVTVQSNQKEIKSKIMPPILPLSQPNCPNNGLPVVQNNQGQSFVPNSSSQSSDQQYFPKNGQIIVQNNIEQSSLLSGFSRTPSFETNDCSNGQHTVQSNQGQSSLTDLAPTSLCQSHCPDSDQSSVESNNSQPFSSECPESSTDQVSGSSNKSDTVKVIIQIDQGKSIVIDVPKLTLSEPNCSNNGLPIVESNQGQPFLPNIPSQSSDQQYFSNNGQSNVQSNIDKSSFLAGFSQTSSFEARGCNNGQYTIESNQGQSPLLDFSSISSSLPNSLRNDTSTVQNNQIQLSFMSAFTQSPSPEASGSSIGSPIGHVTVQSNQKELYVIMPPILPLSQSNCPNNGLFVVQSNQGQSFLPNIPSQPNGQQYLSNGGQSNVQSNIDKSSFLAGFSQTSSFEARGCNNGQYTIESNQGQSPLLDFSSISSSLPNSLRNDTSTVQNNQIQLSFMSGFTQSPSPEASGSSIGSPSGHVTVQSNQKELYVIMPPILPLSQSNCPNNGLLVVQSNQGQSFLPNISSQPNGQQYLSNSGQSNVQSNIDKSSLLAGFSQTSSFEARGCNNGQYTIESNQGQSPLSDFSSLSSSLPNSPSNDPSTVQNKQRQLSFKSGFTQSPSPEASDSSIGSPTGHVTVQSNQKEIKSKIMPPMLPLSQPNCPNNGLPVVQNNIEKSSFLSGFPRIPSFEIDDSSNEQPTVQSYQGQPVLTNLPKSPLPQLDDNRKGSADEILTATEQSNQGQSSLTDLAPRSLCQTDCPNTDQSTVQSNQGQSFLTGFPQSPKSQITDSSNGFAAAQVTIQSNQKELYQSNNSQPVSTKCPKSSTDQVSGTSNDSDTVKVIIQIDQGKSYQINVPKSALFQPNCNNIVLPAVQSNQGEPFLTEFPQLSTSQNGGFSNPSRTGQSNVKTNQGPLLFSPELSQSTVSQDSGPSNSFSTRKSDVLNTYGQLSLSSDSSQSTLSQSSGSSNSPSVEQFNVLSNEEELDSWLDFVQSLPSIPNHSNNASPTGQSDVQMDEEDFLLDILKSIEDNPYETDWPAWNDNNTISYEQNTPLDDQHKSNFANLSTSIVEDSLLSSQPKLAYWCSIAYYEYDNQVGETFKVDSNFRSVTIDGFANPNCGNRFCLGVLNNVDRTEQCEKTRLHIGKGVVLDLRDKGDVWLRCQGLHSAFVKSYYLDTKVDYAQTSHVHKLCPGSYVKVFDLRYCHKLMRELMTKTQTNAAIFKKLPPSEMLETDNICVDDFRRLCTLKISLVKGWGLSYPRTSITETPCWLEVRLHGAFQILDGVLHSMREI